MQAVAWRTQTENKKEFSYRLQVEGIKGIRAKNRVLKSVDGWRSAGEGHTRRKEYILLFSRNFNTLKSWLKWAKGFPYELVELKLDGTPKPTKLGIAAKKPKP
jgi:hypothetical protein